MRDEPLIPLDPQFSDAFLFPGSHVRLCRLPWIAQSLLFLALSCAVPLGCSFLTFPVVLRYGVRNSLLISPMPTASTAQILGNNESIEPYTSNIYTRRVLSGEFQVSSGEQLCSFLMFYG